MSNQDISSHFIYTTLTVNSTTLYTYENHQLIRSINNLNCSEIISQDLGLINASKMLVGFFRVLTNARVMNSNLLLYFMKKNISNSDGSNDLMTVITICHINMNKTLVLSALKKIMDKYIDFRRNIENLQEVQPDQVKTKLGEFKLYMNQIIKFEEMNFETNKGMYSYGSTNDQDVDGEEQVINPNSLLLANEEVEEVRDLMLQNINKILARGDKINLLVDQTDRLTSSSLVFQKRTQQIKKKMWLANAKFKLALVAIAIFIIYIYVGSLCGYPFFSQCFAN